MAAQGLIFGPAIALGLAIGIYEAIILHRDVTVPTHRFGHMLHALIFAVAAVFFSINTAFLLGMLPGIPFLNTHTARIAIGLIAAIKIHGVSAALKGSGMSNIGMGETWFHSLFIGALTAGAGYAYPALAPIIPGWLNW